MHEEKNPPSHDEIDMPVIGVSAEEPLSYGAAALVVQLKGLGVYPVLLPHNAEKTEEYLNKIDGLAVLGNPNDIDPLDYGQERHPQSVIPDTAAYRQRMEFEKRLVEKALEKKIPLLGVCGGMQRMNVGGGEEERGSLIQHLPQSPVMHLNDAQPYTPLQFIKLLEGTVLRGMAQGGKGYFAPISAVLPEGVILENSLHHQAVGKIRRGFRAAAIAPDGIVEAIEPDPQGAYAHQWAYGVQWHPEVATSPFSRTLIAGFAGAARDYNKAHATPHVLTDAVPSSVIEKIREGSDAIERLFEGKSPATQLSA